mmetsp:Transcript_28620/g.29771  ORF Transcript_28620/g.29771 Transcript_28620/m.29771 type:complete len:124 (-) Transcript_28620:48-419(-)
MDKTQKLDFYIKLMRLNNISNIYFSDTKLYVPIFVTNPDPEFILPSKVKVLVLGRIETEEKLKINTGKGFFDHKRRAMVIQEISHGKEIFTNIKQYMKILEDRNSNMITSSIFKKNAKEKKEY